MLEFIISSADLIRPLLDGLSNGVVVFDRSWNPVLVNPAAERMLGPAIARSGSAEVGGYFPVFRADGVTPLPRDERPLVRALRGDDLDDQEVVVEHPGGRRVVLSITARALRDRGGEVVGAFGVLRDITEERLAELGLRASERRYRALTAHLPSIAVLLFDRDLRYTLAGGGGLAASGLTPEAIEGRSVLELATPALLSQYRGVFEGRQTSSEITRDDGRRYHVQFVPIRDDGQEISAGMMVAEDITERHEAVASRLEAESLLRAISESMPESIISMDAHGHVISWNRGAEATFGYSAQEMLGRTLEAIVPAHLRDAHRLGVARAAATGEGHLLGATVEITAVRRDGTTFPCELSLSSWTNGKGRFFTGVLRNVSDRKREELALRASEERFRALSQHAPVGIFETDAQGSCLFVNDRWTALSGVAASEAMGDGWTRALHPDDREAVFREWRAACDQRREFRLEYRFHSVGRVVWVSGRAVALRNQGGVIGYLGTVMDITESKVAAEALRRSLHEKEVLLKEIHHRVKNNLQVISSLLRLQAARIVDPQARGVFADTEGRVRSIALLHEKLYRAQNLALVDMDDYIRGLTTELLRAYGAVARGARVVTDVIGVSLGIDVAVPCGLIINELVTNALKHAFPGGEGRVDVRMRQAGDLVELVVSDDGVGLPPEVDPAKAPTLGLRLVRTLCRQLKAKFALERNAGTRCTVSFQPGHSDGEEVAG